MTKYIYCTTHSGTVTPYGVNNTGGRSFRWSLYCLFSAKPLHQTIMPRKDTYRQTSNINAPNPDFYMFLVSFCISLCAIHWNQELSGAWRLVGTAPTGIALTTPEFSTVLLPTEVWLVWEVWRYFPVMFEVHGVMCMLYSQVLITSQPYNTHPPDLALSYMS